MSVFFLITLLTFVAVGLLAYFAMSLFTTKKTMLQERLEDLRKEHVSYEAEVVVDTSKHGDTKLFKAVDAISSALPISTGTQSKYRKMLIQAGCRKGSAIGIFFGLKVVAGLGLFLVLCLYTLSVRHDPRLALVLGILGFIAGLLMPNVWLNEKMKKRKTEIFHSLPDVLDLMTVCVEAGLGLDAAIIKISEERQFAKHVLAFEFRIVSQEIRAGKPRSEALRDMGDRTGVDDIKSLVALLIQTDKLGASLARSLRVHSDSLRTKRRQMAEEAAAKTPIKLIFPLAFFIFPALMVVLLGPAVIKIFDTLLGHAVK